MNKTTLEALKHSDSCYNALRLAEEALLAWNRWSQQPSPETTKALAAIHAALAVERSEEALAKQQDKPEECAYGCPENTVCDYCQRAEPVKQEPVLVSDVFSFLLGEKPLNGVWFGEKPEGVKGNFWWRTNLRKALAAPVDAKAIREALAESVKQSQLADASLEPVGEHDLQDVRCECCGYMTYHREHMGCIRAAYAHATPVDVKAIREALANARAEALEEAAKVCDRYAENSSNPMNFAENCAAAIRSLK